MVPSDDVSSSNTGLLWVVDSVSGDLADSCDDSHISSFSRGPVEEAAGGKLLNGLKDDCTDGSSSTVFVRIHVEAYILTLQIISNRAAVFQFEGYEPIDASSRQTSACTSR